VEVVEEGKEEGVYLIPQVSHLLEGVEVEQEK
jgi:hypothetical protein